ncbi:MAG: DUF4440 domain-containing protein [Aliifodinibius sp.]|nr:DUF4440 domain-containing protein [Fodinibius sp.]
MKFKKVGLFITLLLSFVFFASAGAQDNKTDLQQVRKASKEYEEALKRGDMDRVAEIYADDAMKFPPNQVSIKGKPAIKENWQEGHYTYFEFIRKHEAELFVSGDIAYEFDADYAVKYKGQEDKEVRGGDIRFKQIRIWKKQADGSWKLYLEMWSSNQELPPGT